MKSMKLTHGQIKALIFYGLLHNYNITQIYTLCYPDETSKDTASIASHWKKGQRIATIFDEAEKDKVGTREMIRREFETDETSETGAKVDFTDKGEFIKYLNGAANRIKDDKLKNDILKMLSDHLDFKDENKRDDSNNIQRFYLPLRCQDCKLYQVEKVATL